MDFLSTYAAIRFTTGKKAPGVIAPLAKAFVLIVGLAIYMPVAIAIWLYRNIQVQIGVKPADRQTTHRGFPAKFNDHVADLQEEMTS